jgi:hypothetical protein
MSLIIDYVNKNQNKFGVTMKYSLLTEYFDSIKNMSSRFPTYDYDFFPNTSNDWAIISVSSYIFLDGFLIIYIGLLH